MENRTSHKILYWVFALAILLVLFVCTYPLTNRLGVRKAGKQSVDVVLLGDSFFAYSSDDDNLESLLSEATGLEVLNVALGGTTAAHLPGDYDAGYYKGALSFCEIGNAILTDEFGPLLKARNGESATAYFTQTIPKMACADYSNADYIFICYGLNDYHAGVPISNLENPYDINTYMGAMRYGIEKIRQICPNTKVVLVTSPYTWYPGQCMSCEEYSPGGTILKEYVQATIELAEEQNCLLIDLYHELYEHNEFMYWKSYTVDGVHPNEDTRKAVAERLKDFISIYEG